MDLDLGQWHRNQLEFLGTYLTWPGLILACLGILRGFFAGQRSLLLLLALLGIPNLYLFMARAWNHDFWICTLLPLCAVGVGLSFEGLLQLLRLRWRVCAVLGLIGLLVLGMLRAQEMEKRLRTTFYQASASYLNTVAHEGDIVLTALHLHPAEFYMDAALLGDLKSVQNLKYFLRRIDAKKLIGRVIYVDLPGETSPSAEVLRLLRGYPRKKVGPMNMYTLRPSG